MNHMLLLPLDNRPCNSRFPRSIAQIAGYPLRVIDELAGGSALLVGFAKRYSAMIISLDRLCYGGLFESRTASRSFGEACGRLQLLKLLKKENLKLHIHVFSVLPRLNPVEAVPGTTREELEFGNAVSDWAKSGPWNFDNDGKVIGAPEAAEDRMRRGRLAQYLEMRERNTAVIREAMTLVSKGVISSLGIFLDDTAPEGLHRLELAEIERKIHELDVKDNVSILPGTDEASMLLVCRTILAETGIEPPNIYAVFSTPEGAQIIGRYEDRPMIDVIHRQVALAESRIVFDREEADILLYVHTPSGAQGEHILLPEYMVESLPESIREFLNNLKSDLECGSVVALADVAYANGADPQFLDELAKRIPLDLLDAFAAWNTAGNTLGTALAHAIARYIGRNAEWNVSSCDWQTSELRHMEFLLERLLDDGYYQAIVRPLIRKEFRDVYRAGIPHMAQAMRERARKLLLSYAERLFGKYFIGRELLSGDTVVGFKMQKCVFPLDRDFEIDLRIKFLTRQSDRD